MVEELAILIPGVLGIGVFIAFILTKDNAKFEEREYEMTMSDSTLKAIHDATKEGVKEALKEFQPTSAVPDSESVVPSVAKEPFDIERVYPADEGQDANGGASPPAGLMDRVWQVVPAVIAVLISVYLMQGYVTVNNYAADSKGLNDRISITENTSVAQINKAVTGIAEQINAINADIATIRVKEQTFATSNSVAEVNTNIGKLQGDLQNVSGNIQALQVSVTLLRETQNTTGNVTENITQ